MAVAGLMSVIGKVLAWWRDVDWRACFAYSVTGIPAAALGARTLLVLPPNVIDLVLGLFFLMMIPGQRLLSAHKARLQLWHLAIIGGAIGFLDGIVASTGPLSVPALQFIVPMTVRFEPDNIPPSRFRIPLVSTDPSE